MTEHAALETVALSKRFGDFLAVDDLSLSVREGEVFGFLGPNGAGKTTTIRMMAGLLRPTSGQVRVLGRDVSPRDPGGRRLVGVVPQENVLYPELTPAENLEFTGALYGVPRRERRRRAKALLERLGLAEKARARVDKLSGGMKRRVTIALGLVHDPPIVVLDEPEAGLDPQTRVVVRDFVRELKEDKTVILTSHNMDEVERLADRVGIIDRGRLVVVGTPADLKGKLGHGDHLEITLEDGAAPRVGEVLAAGAFGEVRVDDRIVSVRGLDLARQFPVIVERVHKAGAAIQDVRYRGNTLEDVFIHLTGRALRE